MQHAPHHAARSRIYTIGELCDEFGVTARALRFYEDEGLIAPERRGTASGSIAERDRARLAWILRGKRVGFSLADIHEMLDLYDLGDGRQTQRRVTLEQCRGTDRHARASSASTSTPRSTELDTHSSRMVEARATARLIPKEEPTCRATPPPSRDTRYVLDHVARPRATIRTCPASPNATPDMVEAILTEGGRFAAEVLQPLNRSATSRAARATTTARSPRRRASRRPGTSSSPAAGRRLSAPRGIWRAGPAAGRRRPRSPNICSPPTRLRNVQRPDPGRDRLDPGQGLGRAEGANICPTWSPATGPGR